MKGLIIKEFLGLRQYFRVLGFLLFAYIIMSWCLRTTGIFPAINAFLIMICVLNSFNYDELNHWEPFVLTFPLSKTDMVRSKYLFILLLCAASTVMTLLLSLTVGYFLHTSLSTVIIGSAASIFAGMFLAALFTPVIYQYGTEKARYIIVAIIMVPTFLLMTFGRYLNPYLPPGPQVLTLLAWALPVLVIFLFFLSYRISKRIVLKREY
ncbi:ABC-2 transporter permease [Eubacterium sp. 1001713B170207_170306_E7]|uniref:ABC-2 transporter permease n=1 Tax=Eubacterium sp. 1001713B170207_170306_E7 TaxID=2787097 RepID=UPI00189B06E5|nr:ABC-2 transporter permease [Eubacterium sp. 1001713B170207_170306_E7]